jgi:hypothetical protein
MNKEEVIKLIVNSINQDNREMSERGGMDKNEIEKQIERSQPTLTYMAESLYNKLIENKVIQN